MQFVPAVFACSSVMWQIEDDWQPMIVYTPRGIGQWKQKPAEPDQSLEIALGMGRARVLSALAMPLTTTELGRQLDLTSGAVSQHLSRLQQAGLVTPHRSGKRVFYHLTARGQQLLGLFGGV
jgi:DNA-binding MarR family transcriptional regulator